MPDDIFTLIHEEQYGMSLKKKILILVNAVLFILIIYLFLK